MNIFTEIKKKYGLLPGQTPPLLPAPPPAPGLSMPNPDIQDHSLISKAKEMLSDWKTYVLPPLTGGLSVAFNPISMELMSRVSQTPTEVIAPIPEQYIKEGKQEVLQGGEMPSTLTMKAKQIGQRALPEVFGELPRPTPTNISALQSAYPGLKDDPYLSAAFATVSDILLDPTMRIPVGALGRSAKVEELAQRLKKTIPEVEAMLAKAQKTIAKPMVGEGANLESGMARIRKGTPELKAPEAPIPEVAKGLEGLAQEARKYKSSEEFTDGLNNKMAKLWDEIKKAPAETQSKLLKEYESITTPIKKGIEQKMTPEARAIKNTGIGQMAKNQASKEFYTDIWNQAQATGEVKPTPTIAPKASETALQGEVTPKPSITTTEQGLIEEAKKYKTVEEFKALGFDAILKDLRNVERDSIVNVPLKDIEIIWKQDLQNARELVRKGDISKKTPPVEFIYDIKNGKYKLDDGHNRYIAAQRMGISLKGEITKIDGNLEDLAQLYEKEKGVSIADIFNKAHAGETKPISNIVKETPPIKQVGGGGEIPPSKLVIPSPLEPEIPQQGATRGFLETAITSKETTPEAKAVLQGLPQTRDVLTNSEALSKADEVIARLGPEEASKQVLDLSVPFSGEKSALGIRLIRKYENDKNWEKMTELVNSLSDQMTKGGQGNQVAKLMSMMSPEGFLRHANKIGEKVGRPLSDSVQQAILKKMSEITAMSHGEARQKAMTELLNFTADNMPLTFGEKFTAYRYQNMLSGLRTQYRNISSNLQNTLITRPIDLFSSSVYDFSKNIFNPLARDAKLLDAPLYYKQIVKSIPESWRAAVESLKKFGSMEKYDLLTGGGESTIENLRRQKMPGYLTYVTRFMEASDKFFSTMIGSGEKSRLLRSGISEPEAMRKATELAETYLYRNKKTLSIKEKAYIVQALEHIQETLLKVRKTPVIGKPLSALTPFITTPTRVAQFSVAHSPLGLIGGKKFYTSPERATQLTKAISGSLVTAAGAYYAMEGKTTWEAPTDPTSKALFYASGKKPYSVNINGVYVPMWYFGPYAVSLAVPAAVKYYEDDSKTALSDSQVDKLGKISGGLTKFVAAQTPLQGVSSFFRILEGDIDFSISNMLGFTAGQVIPAEGLIRYVNTIIDPVYRKARGVKETIMKDLPGLSTKLPYYTEPTGEPSMRLTANYYLPYDIGVANPEYADILKDREAMLQLRALANAMKKEAQLNAMTQPAEEPTPETDNPFIKIKQKQENPFSKIKNKYAR